MNEPAVYGKQIGKPFDAGLSGFQVFLSGFVIYCGAHWLGFHLPHHPPIPVNVIVGCITASVLASVAVAWLSPDARWRAGVSVLVMSFGVLLWIWAPSMARQGFGVQKYSDYPDMGTGVLLGFIAGVIILAIWPILAYPSREHYVAGIAIIAFVAVHLCLASETARFMASSRTVLTLDVERWLNRDVLVTPVHLIWDQPRAVEAETDRPRFTLRGRSVDNRIIVITLVDYRLRRWPDHFSTNEPLPPTIVAFPGHGRDRNPPGRKALLTAGIRNEIAGALRPSGSDSWASYRGVVYWATWGIASEAGSPVDCLNLRCEGA